MQCSLCFNEAVYKSRYSGRALCIKCFKRGFEERVRDTINKYKLFGPKDRILVAVSGGKDSLVLLSVLHRIASSHRDVELIALTVDEGVEGYRVDGIRAAKEIAERLGVDHYVVSFKEVYGYSLDEIYVKARERGSQLHACTFCGVLRRKVLNLKAKELKATKVATGHNLDDEAQTILINMLRGNLLRLVRIGAKPSKVWEGFVSRVKPLRYIPEAEIALYAYFNDFKLYEEECRYVRLSMRDEVRRLLNKLEAKHPGVKYAMVRSWGRLATLIEKEVKVEVRPCQQCGEPTARNICRPCEVLKEIEVLT